MNIGQATSKWLDKKNIKYVFDIETKSTSDLAKAGGFKPENEWVYLTNRQTQGRGRNQNTWENAEKTGEQLLISWCFKLDTPAQPISSPIFGNAVYKAVDESFEVDASIKAPNDIYIKDKKLGGILLESVTQGSQHFICVGLGLNIYDSPEGVNATHLSENSQAEIVEDTWFKFIDSLHSQLLKASKLCQSNKINETQQGELLAALKKWPKNEVKNILDNGNLVLNDQSIIGWNQL